VIYLRHVFAASGLPVPSTVAVVVDDVEWLVAQVGAEMEALFPDARVIVNGAAVATDLLVVVYPGGTRPEDRLTRVSSRAREARVGVALYCVDDRRFDLVGASDLVRWERDRRRRRRVLGLSRRLPRVWNRVVRRLVAP
jgi:hypothetical protein